MDIIYRTVQKLSFEFRLDLWIWFLHALRGSLVFLFSNALACTKGSNRSCTYVTLMKSSVMFEVNCGKMLNVLWNFMLIRSYSVSSLVFGTSVSPKLPEEFIGATGSGDVPLPHRPLLKKGAYTLQHWIKSFKASLSHWLVLVLYHIIVMKLNWIGG